MFHKENTVDGLMSFSLFSTIKRSVQQYSTQLPDFILENFKNCNGNILEKEQILKALEFNEQNFSFQEDELNDELLKKITHETNSSLVHFSGNCSLLSTCLLFNLKNGKNILAAKNTFPFYEGVSAYLCDRIIFGDNLVRLEKSFSTITELEEKILYISRTIGERFFRISTTGYNVPLLGESGHDLNAIVRGSGLSAAVIYLDAWKTSDLVLSAQELQEKYKSATFAVEFYPGPLPTFTNQFGNNFSI